MVLPTAISTPAALDIRWYWREVADVPYLTCSLLDGFDHGFFTHHAEGRSPASLAALLHPGVPAYHTRQVHGNSILTPTEIGVRPNESTGADALPAADGTLSDRPQQSMWTASADCTPALVTDINSGRAAAVHAGWRGTARRILPCAIARFLAAGSRLDDLRVAMGPAIAGAVYQVDTSVAAEVGASLFPELSSATAALLTVLRALPDPPVLPDSQPNKARLDVRRINALQLLQLGLPPERIAIAPHCTYQEPERFFSYRRTRKKAVQWSGIVSRSPASA
ncbi:uncharacterized protein, YfiH family [Rubidibacter lacunae KORDI 51-2]|uniref:Purine nucleoside phosphorylase n=1 Tax=Rubidibacter lacunae KORDI 51-2 TaxID=582515 RepID=U5DJK3_9CHRO|nr:peptidoglycan editing factor PgeF [Rubidibacter lacunae]ERN40759.1 uncharacterized protein, YfiH family [Rubidibacter lacunae KORDI 51-2]